MTIFLQPPDLEWHRPQSIVSDRNPTLLLLALCVGLISSLTCLHSQDFSFNSIRENFIENHCLDCHDDLTRKSGLDLSALTFEVANEDQFNVWVRVHDRVKAGEMPPKNKPRPTTQEVDAFVGQLASELIRVERAALESQGRAVQRRLNRYEYENTLRDLLDVPWIQIKDRLPEDGEKHRYNKIGEALDVSHVQLVRYLSSADHALRQAMGAELGRTATSTRRYYARDEFSLTANFRPRENSTLPDRHSFPVLDSRAQPDVRAGRSPLSSPETREREAVGRVSSIFSDAGGYSWSQFRVPVAGRYRLRFKGYTIWVSGGGISRWYFEGFGAEKAPVYYLPLWHRPNVDEVWPGRRDEPIGVYASSSGQNRPLGEFDFKPEPTIQEVEVVLALGEVIRTDGMRLFRTRVNGSDEQYINPLAQPDGIPGYAVQWMEVEGPLDHDSESVGYQRLIGDLPMRRLEEGESGLALEVVIPQDDTNRARGFGPGGGRRGRFNQTQEVQVEVVTDEPQMDGERLIRRFIERVYRRPPSEAEIQLFVDLFKEQYDLGYGFSQSMISAYTAVLSSPGFLYAHETPGPLDDYAIAARLSYFLWNSEPDDTLRALAQQGELKRPEVLREQTDRLLGDERFRRFVEAFTDYWLDLRKLDETSPSTTLYNDYELDDALKLAALEETRRFVEELFREDLPARNIVDSDFTFLNERLAVHYGLEGVRGVAMRRVSLPSDSVRGGLMTQASVLKVTANGTTTSPVLRGH